MSLVFRTSLDLSRELPVVENEERETPIPLAAGRVAFSILLRVRRSNFIRFSVAGGKVFKLHLEKMSSRIFACTYVQHERERGR